MLFQSKSKHIKKQRRELYELFDHYPHLWRRKKQFIKLATPTIAVENTPLEEDFLPLGASKVGGYPDLPASLDWPCDGGGELYLGFIGQFNLSQVARHNLEKTLPNSGILYFFFSQEAFAEYGNIEDAQKVFYYDGPLDQLSRQAFPDGISEEEKYPPSEVDFSTRLTLPAPSSLIIQSMNLTPEEQDHYWDLYFTFTRSHRTSPHQILGHPDQVQGDIQLECETAGQPIGLYQAQASPENLRRASRWKVLFQAGYDEDIYMCWGDGGSVYFCIDENDLRRENFHQGRVVYQGG